MTSPELAEVLEFFGQEQACYTALLDLSRRQKGVIEGGEVDDLLAILGQKQGLLAKVGRIEEDLRPYKRSWRTLRASLDESSRQVLDLALATVEELLAELIALEKESERLLVARRDASKRELTEAIRGAAVHQAYAIPSADGSAGFLDIRES